MKKHIPKDEPVTRAERRAIKKRPRMRLHGAGLKKSAKHGGGLIMKGRDK